MNDDFINNGSVPDKNETTENGKMAVSLDNNADSVKKSDSSNLNEWQSMSSLDSDRIASENGNNRFNDPQKTQNGYYSGGYAYSNQGSQYSSQYPYTGSSFYNNQSTGNQNQQQYSWNFNDYNTAHELQQQQKAPKKKRAIKIAAIAVSIVLAFSVISFAVYGVYSAFDLVLKDRGFSATSSGQTINNNANENGIIITENKNQTEGTQNEGGALTAQGVIAKVKPSVVGVVTYKQLQSYQPYSQGSGIIMSENGYIVTNAHVVSGADSFKVVLSDESEHDAKLIGADTKTDLAVLKIEAKNLTKATFGNSDKVVDGETVIAIGNPGGLELSGSSTQGIVSATNRYVKSNESDGFAMKCIQTDAAINPGNSGGALVNMYGQVIGINSSKIVASGFEGIGFAISINEAQPIVDDLLKYGYVKDRAKIGISVATVDEWTAKMNNVPTGVMVAALTDPSMDAASKLKKGDIIVEIDGTKISTTNDLFNLLQNRKPGDVLKIKAYRTTSTTSDKYITVNVTLGEDKGTAQ